MRRPVAAILICSQGVSVRPLFDATKVGLAALMALGAMLAFGRRFRQASRR